MPEDAGGLAAFVASMGDAQSLRVEESLGNGYVRLLVSEAERRQAKHDIRCVEDIAIELLRNSRDAGAHVIYVATTRDGDLRNMVVLDDGMGIPPDMQEHVFEARVTSKLDSVHTDRWGVHGRGMALFSVRENARSARVMASGSGLGCSLRVVVDTKRLPERRDQSTWPRIGSDDDGRRSCVRGPHNIIRTCCDFALEEHGGCEVYLGSPAEVVATARARTRRRATSGSPLPSGEATDGVPLIERLRLAPDASELRAQAHALGLDISERTSHRIVAGQVKPLRSVYSQLVGTREPAPGSVDLMRDRRSLKVSKDDIDAFSRVMETAFSSLGDSYYLSLVEPPSVSVSRDRVVVTFRVEEQD